MRRRNSMTTRNVLILGLIGTLALSACSRDVAPQASPTPTATQESTVTEPQPTKTPVALPGCDTMNATAKTEAEAFAGSAAGETVYEVDLGTFTAQAGPVARATMDDVTRVAGCGYTVYFQNVVEQWEAELPQADQKPLIDALRASDMEEKKLGDALTFTLTTVTQDEPGAPGSGGGQQLTAYIFVGDVWVSIIGNGALDYIPAAIDGVRGAQRAADGGAATEPAKDTGSDAKPQSCSGMTGAAALAKWGPDVEGYWDFTGQYSDASGYDECAEMSWIILREDPCCRSFSPTPLMLFRNGEFVSTATTVTYALDSEKPVTRVSDGKIRATFMWPGVDLAGPANKTTSTFAWNPENGAVERSGQLPPG